MTIYAWGVDYSEGLNLAVLRKYNTKFACRYIGYTSPEFSQAKILTRNEVSQLRSADIDIVSNWEWDGLTPKEGFAQGVKEAGMADQLHAACGGPPDRPIYFSSDFAAQGPEVAEYYKGVASIIGLSRTGAYGPYACIKYLLDNHLITYAWQTYAWSNNQQDTRINIYQYLNGVNLEGMILDYNNALKEDYGQWGYKQVTPHPAQNSSTRIDQFNAVWKSTPLGMKYFGSGLYRERLSASLIDDLPSTTPTSDERSHTLDTPPQPIKDWNGVEILWQDYADGSHGEWNTKTNTGLIYR